jgi:hypothetical protein
LLSGIESELKFATNYKPKAYSLAPQKNEDWVL